MIRQDSMNLQVASVTCPVCEGGEISICDSYRGTHAIFFGINRAQCRTCEMVFAAPMPNNNQLEEYNARYFDTAHGGISENIIAKAFFTGIARLRFSHLERYIQEHSTKVSNVLEMGPGTGYFAKVWIDKFPKTLYNVIETDSSCHNLLREIGVHVINPSTDKQNIDSIDLVVMSHVLEHVSSPIEFIASTTRNLKKGGVIFIEVPCRDWEHKPNDEPHLLFFDKKPMLYLLEKLGYVDIQVSYHGIEIEKLRANQFLKTRWMAIRNKFISMGMVSPFAKIRHGMEEIHNPVERAAVAPFKAHVESVNPSWWLRATARKK